MGGDHVVTRPFTTSSCDQKHDTYTLTFARGAKLGLKIRPVPLFHADHHDQEEDDHVVEETVVELKSVGTTITACSTSSTPRSLAPSPRGLIHLAVWENGDEDEFDNDDDDDEKKSDDPEKDEYARKKHQNYAATQLSSGLAPFLPAEELPPRPRARTFSNSSTHSFNNALSSFLRMGDHHANGNSGSNRNSQNNNSNNCSKTFAYDQPHAFVVCGYMDYFLLEFHNKQQPAVGTRIVAVNDQPVSEHWTMKEFTERVRGNADAPANQNTVSLTFAMLPLTEQQWDIVHMSPAAFQEQYGNLYPTTSNSDSSSEASTQTTRMTPSNTRQRCYSHDAVLSTATKTPSEARGGRHFDFMKRVSLTPLAGNDERFTTREKKGSMSSCWQSPPCLPNLSATTDPVITLDPRQDEASKPDVQCDNGKNSKVVTTATALEPCTPAPAHQQHNAAVDSVVESATQNTPVQASKIDDDDTTSAEKGHDSSHESKHCLQHDNNTTPLPLPRTPGFNLDFMKRMGDNSSNSKERENGTAETPTAGQQQGFNLGDVMKKWAAAATADTSATQHRTDAKVNIDTTTSSSATGTYGTVGLGSTFRLGQSFSGRHNIKWGSS